MNKIDDKQMIDDRSTDRQIWIYLDGYIGRYMTDVERQRENFELKIQRMLIF